MNAWTEMFHSEDKLADRVQVGVNAHELLDFHVEYQALKPDGIRANGSVVMDLTIQGAETLCTKLRGTLDKYEEMKRERSQ